MAGTDIFETNKAGSRAIESDSCFSTITGSIFKTESFCIVPLA